MNSNASDVHRVAAGNLEKTIQDIKEIAGKHSDDDIYAMLKECNMDPNETAQRLLYLDTFHEVKKKRDKRKSNVSIQANERPRWTSGMQRRGARGGRGNDYYTNIPNDAGCRRQMSARQENSGPSHAERSAKLLLPVQPRTASNAAPHSTNSSVTPVYGPRSVSNGGSSNEHIPRASADNIMDLGRGTSVADVNKLIKRPALPALAVKQLSNLNPGPTPTSTPTTASNSSSAPVSGVYSSASDPVLLPSLNPRNPGAVGTIKRETGNQRCAVEIIGSSSESRLTAGQDVRNRNQAGTETNNRASQEVEKSQYPEPSRTSSLLNHDKSSTANNKQDGWPTQQVNGPSKVMKSQGVTVALGANMQSLPELNSSVLEQATPQLEMKLEKLNISNRQPVIFPDHIQVPEAFRNGLTFGSLDDASGLSKNGIKDSKCVERTVLMNHDAAREPPIRHHVASSAALEDDCPGHSQTHSNAPENLSPLEVDASSAAAVKSDHLKPEMPPLTGGSQYPHLQTASEYSFGFVPPMLGPHVVQVEATEVGNSPVPSTSGSSQPATQPFGVGQNSVAISPQLIPLLRQPYPSNYIYNPYFPQLYLSHSAHQFLGHSGFAQQASTGNIYMPPPAAATGVKFPVPSMYKPGAIAGNMAQFGIPSGYGSYGSSAVGYGLGAAMTPGSSAGNEDLAAAELKEKNIYSTLKQSEEPHVWTSAPGRDMSTLQANIFYNFPQGQHLAYSPGQGPLSGVYHFAQTTGAPTTVQSLAQQPQAVAGSVESVVDPTGTYQQPHSMINWNTKFLNRENV
ncbi:GBF-interacting protein 1-like isoform X2 [Coffea eugenioides]|uniref:GBF-interacting protein 1-like isoform X2 n=1 Tax=Coffea eugenioides TaxID=49369 RepID=UPI000F60D681|nr:GBF-interacting protein 1-like isoform X2 [Coffea eugenioides]